MKTIEGDISLRSFISGMLSYSPWWIVGLYRIREVLVKALGLVRHEKKEVLSVITPLKAYLGVIAEKSTGPTRFHVFTTVRYIHWTGPVFFDIRCLFVSPTNAGVRKRMRQKIIEMTIRMG